MHAKYLINVASPNDELRARSTHSLARELVAAEELVAAVADALLHLNDPKNELGSHRDGHRKIGEGQIPLEAWPELFAGLPGVPVAMETPHGSPEAHAREARLVKKLAGGLRKAPEGI